MQDYKAIRIKYFPSALSPWGALFNTQLFIIITIVAVIQ